MSQLFIITYALALVIGFISNATTGVIALWTKKRSLLHCFLFYSAYTLDMFVEIVRRYIMINIPGSWEDLALFLNPIMIFTRFFLLYTMIIFGHDLAFKGCKKKMVLLYSILPIICFLSRLSIYIRNGKPVTLVNAIPDYIYIGHIFLILVIGIIYTIRKKLFEFSLMNKTLLLFILSSPLIINDDITFIITPIRFAPLIYTLFSIMIFHHIIKFYLKASSFKEYQEQKDSNLFQNYNISDREKETTLLVLKGYSNNQISQELFISLSTVKSHIYKIYKKIGIKTRFELMQVFKSD